MTQTDTTTAEIPVDPDHFLNTWESYDCTILFIQLNNVNKLKNKMLLPYVNSPATSWHIRGYCTASFSITVTL